ncbi:MAG: VPLPA-CTERM sorting domain-containing protein [Pseudomonadota bacterium]
MLSAVAGAAIALSAAGAAMATPVTDFSVGFVAMSYQTDASTPVAGPAAEPITGDFIFRADLDEAETGIVPFLVDLTVEFPGDSRTATYNTSNTRVEVQPYYNNGSTLDPTLAHIFIEGTTNSIGATSGDFFHLNFVLRKSDFAPGPLGSYYFPQNSDTPYFATEGGLTRLETQPVPVPAALPLLASGVGVFALVRRRRRAG